MTTTFDDFDFFTADDAPDFRARIITAIDRLKRRLHARYQRHFIDRPALLDQAIDEAEAAAWCTAFPHLFLPELAELQIARLAPSRDFPETA